MKSVGSWNSEGSSTLGRLGLKDLFNILVLQLYSLVDQFGLEGRREVFRRVLQFSSLITRLGVILSLHLSSLTL